MVWSYPWYSCWLHWHILTQIFRVLQLFHQSKPSYRPTQTYPAIRVHQKPWCKKSADFVGCQVWRCKRPNKQLLKLQRRKKSKSLPSEKLRDGGKWSWDMMYSKLPFDNFDGVIWGRGVFLISVGKLFEKKRQGSFLSTELKLVWNFTPLFSK